MAGAVRTPLSCLCLSIFVFGLLCCVCLFLSLVLPFFHFMFCIKWRFFYGWRILIVMEWNWISDITRINDHLKDHCPLFIDDDRWILIDFHSSSFHKNVEFCLIILHVVWCRLFLKIANDYHWLFTYMVLNIINAWFLR